MKNYCLLSISLVLLLSVSSCKNTKKSEKQGKETTMYVVNNKTTSVKWTAYKTSAKLPVKGEFRVVEFTKATPGASLKEALNNLEFSIPISSLFSNNEERDAKLKTSFFGAMLETVTIKGKLIMETETSGKVELTLNGITQELPITYFLDGQMATMEATMDLDNWQAQTALSTLNAVCKELHTGPDGITKTWSDVKINIATYISVVK
ncbi:MAG: YceI family protein [Flavobacteriaceae bacterium]|nr:YceI family protein [Flavobacteriaceae bacterium]